MKASQLYVDEYYAYYPYPAKGKFQRGAQKVRVRNVEIRKARGEKNARTMVMITNVATGNQATVPARHILDFWDDYKAEDDALERELIERREKQERERIRRTMLEWLIARKFNEKTGVDLTGRVHYNHYAKSAGIPFDALVGWLGITEDQIERAVEEHLNEPKG